MVGDHIQQNTWLQKRFLNIFILGLASGFPWLLIGSVLSAWLSEEGLSRSTIGLFGSLFVAYSINFLWSPLLDRWQFKQLGRRRSWIIGCQLMMLIFSLLIYLASTDNLLLLALLACAIAFASATQDIAIDAYRIDVIGNHEKPLLGMVAGLATAGWWTGYGGLGAIPFWLTDIGWQWHQLYLLFAMVFGLLICFVAWIKEPSTYNASTRFDNTRANSLGNWLYHLKSIFIQPLREFFSRNGVRLALSILLFVFLFKIGEAFLGRMSIVFYKEIGFTNTEIGTYSKLLNWLVTVFFALVSGYLNLKIGIVKGLLISGVAMASSNLMFSWIASIGPDTDLLMWAIIVDGFTAAWSTVAFVAFISSCCNKQFSASQYALMASLGSLGRTMLAGGSGFMVDALHGNWSLFFMLTAVMVVPSLLVIIRIRHALNT